MTKFVSFESQQVWASQRRYAPSKTRCQLFVFHHDRIDGSGYPLGLKGDEIPITAQIFAIVDVFDALSTDRVYRKAFSQAKSFEILREEAANGLHNPELVETFLTLVGSL